MQMGTVRSAFSKMFGSEKDRFVVSFSLEEGYFFVLFSLAVNFSSERGKSLVEEIGLLGSLSSIVNIRRFSSVIGSSFVAEQTDIDVGVRRGSTFC